MFFITGEAPRYDNSTIHELNSANISCSVAKVNSVYIDKKDILDLPLFILQA